MERKKRKIDNYYRTEVSKQIFPLDINLSLWNRDIFPKYIFKFSNLKDLKTFLFVSKFFAEMVQFHLGLRENINISDVTISLYEILKEDSFFKNLKKLEIIDCDIKCEDFDLDYQIRGLPSKNSKQLDTLAFGFSKQTQLATPEFGSFFDAVLISNNNSGIKEISAITKEIFYEVLGCFKNIKTLKLGLVRTIYDFSEDNEEFEYLSPSIINEYFIESDKIKNLELILDSLSEEKFSKNNVSKLRISSVFDINIFEILKEKLPNLEILTVNILNKEKIIYNIDPIKKVATDRKIISMGNINKGLDMDDARFKINCLHMLNYKYQYAIDYDEKIKECSNIINKDNSSKREKILAYCDRATCNLKKENFSSAYQDCNTLLTKYFTVFASKKIEKYIFDLKNEILKRQGKKLLKKQAMNCSFSLT